MKNKKFKLTFLGAALCFTLVGCSNDDSVNGTNNNSESGVISNGEITLTYGSDLLNHNVQSLNERLNIQGMNGTSARSGNSIPAFNAPDESSATVLTSADQNLNLSTGSYIIPNNSTALNINFNVSGNAVLILKGDYTGTLNLNGGTLYIDKDMTSGFGSIQLNGGNVVVAPGKTVNFNKNLNNGTLSNWGIVGFSQGSINGNIVNNNILTFTNQNQTNLNSSSSVTNNCKMIFEGKMHLDENLTNSSYLELNNGFHLNSNGKIDLSSGSYTNVTGGQISMDNGVKVENISTNGLSRFDISSNVSSFTVANVNTPNFAFKGFIDINHSFNIIPSQNQDLTAASREYFKADANVVFKQNTYTGSSNCMVSVGTAPSSSCSITALDETARYIGLINPVIQDGVTLSATDVKVVDNPSGGGKLAYVSYHTNDELFGGFPYGSIRVFKIDGNSIEEISQAIFNNCEFNALEINDNKVIAVGNNLDGGRMYVAPTTLFNGTPKDFNDVWSTKTPSLGGKSIAFNNNTLWLVGGANGGLYKSELVNGNYNLTASTSPFVTQTGGKYVAFKNSKQVFFAINNAGNPYLRIASADGTLIAEKIDTDITLTNRDGKNAISIDNQYVYVALSEKGVAKYSLTDGSLVSRFVPSTVRNASGSRVFPNNGLSNAVTSDDCYVYVANGSDGVIILDKTTFKHVGYFKTGLEHSTNFVYVKDNYLFVANGRHGLRVIKLN